MMKKRPQPTRDWHERRLEAARYSDQPRLTDLRKSPTSRAGSTKRTKKPGEAGLANEVRPGLGTRAKTPPAKVATGKIAVAKGKKKATAGKTKGHDEEPMGRVAPLPPAKPRPAPREQSPDSFAHEQERDTGVSGHAGGD